MSYNSNDRVKPSSRVLKPPGGGSSGIFCNCDEPTTLKQCANTKPTYQSSVFKVDPDPVTSRPTTQTENTASHIFGSDDDGNNAMTTPKKMSRTQQSSVFSMPESAPDAKGKGPKNRRISDIPMFSSTGPEEQKRPCRRPITIPTRMPQGAKAAMYDATSYAADSGTGVGQIKKILKGYKPANASLHSTVFAQNEVNLGPKGDEDGLSEQDLFALPEMPRVYRQSKTLDRNPIAAVFSKEDIEQIRAECRRRPMSATYYSEVFDTASVSNTDLGASDSTKASNNEVKKLKPHNPAEFAFYHMSEEIDKASIPIWSADGTNCSFTTNNRLKMRVPSILRKETAYKRDHGNPIWSSGNVMTPCSVLPRSEFSSHVSKSTLFSLAHTDAQFAKPVLSKNEAGMCNDRQTSEVSLSVLSCSMKRAAEN